MGKTGKKGGRKPACAFGVGRKAPSAKPAKGLPKREARGLRAAASAKSKKARTPSSSSASAMADEDAAAAAAPEVGTNGAINPPPSTKTRSKPLLRLAKGHYRVSKR